jgi:hypothetical protein
MRAVQFLIFFSIFFTVYSLVNYYIYIRGLQALPRDGTVRYWYTGLFILLSLSFIAGRFLERLTVCAASDLMVWVGSFWLGFMLYFFLAVLLLDIARIGNHFTGFFPSFITINYERTKLISMAAVIAVSSGIVIAGYINALNPRITRLEISVPGKAPVGGQMDIALATDIHLGVLISNSRLETLVNKINELDPDLVLLAGDIVDEDLAPVIEKNLGETLRTLRARHGVYAVTGNHEYIGGVEEAVRYLEKHGINVLRDRTVLIDDRIYIAGREDRSIYNFAGQRRKYLKDILSGIDRRYPVILMDHQPYGLREAADNGVALQVSGHTHNGQLWPFNYITRMIYEISYGYGRIADTHFFVSNGFGTWGPPVRTENRPEIVHIRMSFE